MCFKNGNVCNESHNFEKNNLESGLKKSLNTGKWRVRKKYMNRNYSI